MNDAAVDDAATDTDPPSAEAEAADAPERKGERTRRQLLEIAIELFGASGYRSTSVSEVTRTAGLTQAASYAYFDSKEELFREAVNADAEALIHEATAQVRDQQIQPRQLVPALLLYLGGGLATHPLAKRVLQGREPEVVDELIDLPAIHELGALVAEAIRAGRESGDVRDDLDPEAVGAGVEAMLLGLTMSLALGEGATTERHAFGVVSAFDAMLRPA